MRFRPPASAFDMTAALHTLLSQLRAGEPFDVVRYVNEKAHHLNSYFSCSGLSAAVVAVSGGADSAAVLALVHHAMQQPDSPIRRIVPVLLPVHDPDAATNQDIATLRGQELCHTLGLTPCVIDLTKAHSTTKALVDSAANCRGQAWASGQLVAYQRTPALYYLTALLSEQGTPAVLIGTTNYDEGAYLGYFGKASDGLVDLQLISDLHKSQVYAVAEYLAVPSSILTAVPTGDMFDGRTDEEVFGTSYDFVELFLRAKRDGIEVGRLLTALDAESQCCFHANARSLEDLHRYNAHKYIGRSPAVHLDLWDWSFEGSWNYQTWSAHYAR
jgi:NAD+ synthetase